MYLLFAAVKVDVRKDELCAAVLADNLRHTLIDNLLTKTSRGKHELLVHIHYETDKKGNEYRLLYMHF